MALKIILKPEERIILGGAVIRNGKSSAQLVVENRVPLLRQKDILAEEEADTPCKRIYFAVQLMYVDEGNLAEHHKLYWSLAKDVLKAAPGTLPLLDRLNELILAGRYYPGLKIAKQLIAYEEEAIRHASRPSGNL